MLLPLLILAAGVSIAYWIGYPWPWSAALAELSPRAEAPSPHRWVPAPREPDEPRYWFLRFSVHPHEKIYEQWAYGDSPVSAMNAISTVTGGQFIVLNGDPISRLMPPRFDVKVFGEPGHTAKARAEHQRKYPPVNARLALSEVQRSQLPPMRFTANSGLIDEVVNKNDTAPELQRIQYIVPQTWLTIPSVVKQLKSLDQGGRVDVLVMRHVNGRAVPFRDFL